MSDIRLRVEQYYKRDNIKSVVVYNYKGDLFEGRVKINEGNGVIEFKRVGLDDRDSRKLTKAGNRYYTKSTWTDAEFGDYEYSEEDSDEDTAVFYYKDTFVFLL